MGNHVFLRSVSFALDTTFVSPAKHKQYSICLGLIYIGLALDLQSIGYEWVLWL